MEDQEKTEMLRQSCERIMSESKAVAYAMALRDYETGFRFTTNADRRFHAASTIKVAILLATGKAIDVSLGTLYSGQTDSVAGYTVGAVNVRAQSFIGNVFNVSASGAASSTKRKHASP